MNVIWVISLIIWIIAGIVAIKGKPDAVDYFFCWITLLWILGGLSLGFI